MITIQAASILALCIGMLLLIHIATFHLSGGARSTYRQCTLTKQGDNALGSICLCICPFVCGLLFQLFDLDLDWSILSVGAPSSHHAPYRWIRSRRQSLNFCRSSFELNVNFLFASIVHCIYQHYKAYRVLIELRTTLYSTYAGGNNQLIYMLLKDLHQH